MTTPTVLPAAALSRLAPTPAASAPGYARRGLVRGLLYLVPVLLAVAAGEHLGRPPWPVPAGTLVVGWCALSALAPLGRAAAMRGGVVRATRLGLAAGQAALVVLVWRVGDAVAPAGGVPPTLVPLLAALPMIEIWVGWHLARAGDGLARYDDRERYWPYVHRLGRATLAALLPALAAGAALAGTAARLPFGLSAHPDAPALVLAMASGVLLAGVVAVGWLLAARDRPGLAAAVTGTAVVSALALPVSVPSLAATSFSGWGQLLPGTAIALAVAYAVGLVLLAQVVFDTRSLR